MIDDAVARPMMTGGGPAFELASRNRDGKGYVAVIGPTGSGKSRFALWLAEQYGGEIIGCDSVQVYRGFDIGSAKEVGSVRDRIPHHLIDILDWQQSFDAEQYATMARDKVAEVNGRNRLAIVVGGTGLYMRALEGRDWHQERPHDPELRRTLSALSKEELCAELQRRDPARAQQIHPNDHFRLARAVEILRLGGSTTRGSVTTEEAPPSLYPPTCVFGIDLPRPELHRRIRVRSQQIVENGLLSEVRALLDQGVDPRCKPMQSIGYKQAVQALNGELPRERLVDHLVYATRQYAKRQITWFRDIKRDYRLGLAMLEGDQRISAAYLNSY